MRKNLTRILVLLFVLFTAAAQAQVDTTIGITPKGGSSKNYKKLAHNLCDDIPDDRGKVNAIYNWVTHHIKYDVKAMQEGHLKKQEPRKVLKQGKALCDGYAELVAAMCKEVGIQAVVVEGYAKDWMFDNGDKLYIPRHAWNAVFVGLRWELLDASWGAGGLGQSPGWLKSKLNKAAKDPLQYAGKLKFKYKYDPQYFLMDPSTFRLRHLPSDPVWQLTDSLMPLEVFEAGEAAIKQFNESYGKRSGSDMSLNQLGALDDYERLLASADRSYKYNPRYHIIMAASHQVNALKTIGKEKELGNSGNTALDGVNLELKSSENYLALQKRSMTSEYSELKRKNKTKNLDAKKYIVSIHNDNKRLSNQCATHLRSAESTRKSIKEKAGTFHAAVKKTNADHAKDLKPLARQDEASSPALLAIEDSVTNRNQRIAALKDEATQLHSIINKSRESHRSSLDTLAVSLGLADSVLVKETIARLNMHDNYDDEVIMWNSLVKDIRLKQVDSQQKYYLAGYDTLVKQYESLRKLQWQKMGLYQKNLKDLAQYKRRNSSNTAMLSQYDQTMQEYTAGAEIYEKTLAEQDEFISGNKGLFEALVKLYKRQEKLAGYMEKAEEHRKELEETTLTKKEGFDKKENEHQKEQIKQTGRKAEKLLAGR